MSKETRKDYHDYVDSIVADMFANREIKTKDDYEEHRESIYDETHESVVGSCWILYTYNAFKVLEFTNNREAWEDFGELPTDKGLDGIITFCAYCAMHADVMDEITRITDDLPDEIEEEKTDEVEA